MYKYILLVDQTNLLNLQFIEIKKRNTHEIEKSIVFFLLQPTINFNKFKHTFLIIQTNLVRIPNVSHRNQLFYSYYVLNSGFKTFFLVFTKFIYKE